MDQGQRLEKKISHFREKYFNTNSHGGHFTTFEPKFGSDELIKSLIGDICISMKAEDYLKLPQCITVDVPVVLDDKHQKQYKAFEREMLLNVELETITAQTAAVLSGKLLQFSNGAIYDNDGKVITLHSAKLDAFMELVEGLNVQHALVFYSFKHDLVRLKEALSKSKLVVKELKTPQDELDWNSGKIDILLAHPASAAYGLNLQDGGHHIIGCGLSWSLELYYQANKRLHRQGQKEPVIIHRMIVEGTRDQDVANSLSSKADVQNALMQALKARIKEIRG